MYPETVLSKTDYGWLFYQIVEPGTFNSARLHHRPTLSLDGALAESFGLIFNE